MIKPRWTRTCLDSSRLLAPALVLVAAGLGLSPSSFPPATWLLYPVLYTYLVSSPDSLRTACLRHALAFVLLAAGSVFSHLPLPGPVYAVLAVYQALIILAPLFVARLLLVSASGHRLDALAPLVYPAVHAGLLYTVAVTSPTSALLFPCYSQRSLVWLFAVLGPFGVEFLLCWWGVVASEYFCASERERPGGGIIGSEKSDSQPKSARRRILVFAAAVVVVALTGFIAEIPLRSSWQEQATPAAEALNIACAYSSYAKEESGPLLLNNITIPKLPNSTHVDLMLLTEGYQFAATSNDQDDDDSERCAFLRDNVTRIARAAGDIRTLVVPGRTDVEVLNRPRSVLTVLDVAKHAILAEHAKRNLFFDELRDSFTRGPQLLTSVELPVGQGATTVATAFGVGHDGSSPSFWTSIPRDAAWVVFASGNPHVRQSDYQGIMLRVWARAIGANLAVCHDWGLDIVSAHGSVAAKTRAVREVEVVENMPLVPRVTTIYSVLGNVIVWLSGGVLLAYLAAFVHSRFKRGFAS